MKKFVFALIGLIIINVGCKTTKTVQKNLPKLEAVRPIIFIERPQQSIIARVSDSIFFYNSMKIEISGVLGGQQTIIRNHKYETRDTSIRIIRTIESLTAGLLVGDIPRDKNGARKLTTSFSRSDTTFTIFWLREDLMQAIRNSSNDKTKYTSFPGSFVLDGKAWIYFNGVKLDNAKARVIISNDDKSKKTTKNAVVLIEPCRLLYYHDFSKSTKEDYKTAEGWGNGSIQTEINSTEEIKEE